MNSSFRILAVAAAASISFASAAHAAAPEDAARPLSAAPLFNPNAALSVSADDIRYQPVGISSSSADDAIAAGDPSAALGYAGSQPPSGHRRSYGHSRYQDRMHNADGSTKIAFMAGAGLNVTNGNTAKFYTDSWTVSGGAGWNFNRMFGVLGEFHYDHMGLTSGSINTEYNNLLNVLEQQGYTADDLQGFDGNAHVLSLSINPVVNFTAPHSKMGAYVTGGGGWYRKTTNFTLPNAQTGCSFYYCETFYSTYNIDQATANTWGWNAGFGLSYKLSEFSSERLFVDARYHWLPIKSDPTQDFFPYNRRHTGYIPVTVGIRF